MKPIKTVFLIIGVLVLAFLLWQLVFNDGGVLISTWNAIAETINSVWAKITGNPSATIVPEWGDAVDPNKNKGGLNQAQW